MKEFKAIVIGAGQAGGPLAHQLAARDWKVALIEREHLGGSCINYGCTPTKKMRASARIAHLARRAEDYGVQTGSVRLDLHKVVALKDELVQQWREGQAQHAANRPSLSLIRGEATFSGPQQVTVDGELLQGEHIFINTGTSARIPDVPGLAGVPYLTNRSILDLRQIPEHLLVMGGGYVGLEFAQMFRRFGSRVSVVEHGQQIAAREDRDVAHTLQEILEGEDIHFHLGSDVRGVSQSDGGAITLACEGAADGTSFELCGSHLLVAAGRRPNTEALNLQAAGIEHHDGWITVDDQLRTTAPNVYALGDVKGGPAFTHISYNDFQIVLHNLFHDHKRSIEGRLVPYTLFTDPELGRVGMTEKAARAANLPIKVGQIPMSQVARAIERNETAGLMKIVVHAETERILGAAILGVEGGELVQTLMTVMMMDGSWKTLQNAIYIHPTLTEGFFALMDDVARA